jgi:L-malate glycosyltransferase
MTKKKIVIAGAFGIGNFGDEAILSGTLNLLKSNPSFDNSELIVFSRNPIETMAVHGVESRRRNIFDLLRSSEVIIGGGELFQSWGNMVIKYSLLGLISKILGKRVSFHAVGVSSNLGTLGEVLTRLSLNVADYVSVRDQKSKRRLMDLGVKEPIRVLVDPAFSMEAISEEESNFLLVKEGITIDKKNIRIAIVSQYFADRKLSDKIHNFLLVFLKDILFNNPDLQVIFVPFLRHIDNSFDSDIIYGEWLEKRLGTHQFIVLRNSYTPQQMMGILGLMDGLLSTRLHPLILASKMKVPAIGICVFEKTTSFCEDYGIPMVLVNELTMIPEKFSDLICSLRQRCFS